VQHFSPRNLSRAAPLDRGGHFAALEQPEIFVNELRAAFHQPLFRAQLA
jgi:pimeloyl-ACP methyl ester carboxylesterase